VKFSKALNMKFSLALCT